MQQPTASTANPLVALAGRVTRSGRFEAFIVAVIGINALALGVDAQYQLTGDQARWLTAIYDIALVIFIVEAALKMLALAPRPQRYFRDAWNIFDFTIIVLSLVPAVGQLAIVARTARVLRVLRLVSLVPGLRVIVATLVRSIPGMLNIVLVMTVLSYIFAIVGNQMFHEHDPTHWHDLGVSLLSLFRVVTLEDWTDIMYTAMELHPLSWVFFVSYVVLGSFVTANLFVAVVISQLDSARQESAPAPGASAPAPDVDVLEELRAVREALEALRREVAAQRADAADNDAPDAPDAAADEE